MSFFDESPSKMPDAHVSELPLFPLDVVLFPGMKMSLHIFEERYKEMVERCLAGSRLFGIVLLRGDAPAKSPRKVKTHRVGCYARIAHVERLAGGEFNLEIEGVERFRVIEQHEVEAYRTGIVEPMDDRAPVGATEEVVQDLCEEVQTLLEEFLTRQLAALGQHIVEFDFPQNPAVLSLITACILPIGNPDKQSLLEGTDTAARLQTERDVLERAIARMKRGMTARPSKTKRDEETFARTDAGSDAARFVPLDAERYREYLCVN
ncbi:MAG: LON peptidase substrate-binding domain-containing protein [Armatimonadetes bacterium]|nr:LON peptidase substrate-binding domain-containing protein [Armatimonadota bacterium]